MDLLGIVDGAARGGDGSDAKRRLALLVASIKATASDGGGEVAARPGSGRRQVRVFFVAELPCWRFAAGRGSYFGPASEFEREGDEDSPRVVRVSGLAISEGDPGASADQAAVQRAWDSMTMAERSVYVETRQVALDLVASRMGGEVAESIEARLHAARFGLRSAWRFRDWLAGLSVEGVGVLQGGTGDLAKEGKVDAALLIR